MSLEDLVTLASARRFVRRLLWGPNAELPMLDRVVRRGLRDEFWDAYRLALPVIERAFTRMARERDDRREPELLALEAFRDVDDHRQRLRARLGLRLFPELNAEERGQVARGEAFLVQGRFTRHFLPITELPRERVTCLDCDGSRWRAGRRCDACDGIGYREVEHPDYPHSADVLAFAPGHLDGQWWAGFRSRSEPSWRPGFAVTGRTLAEVFARVAQKGVLVA